MLSFISFFSVNAIAITLCILGLNVIAHLILLWGFKARFATLPAGSWRRLQADFKPWWFLGSLAPIVVWAIFSLAAFATGEEVGSALYIPAALALFGMIHTAYKVTSM